MHEAVCAERWGEVCRQLDEVKAAIRGLWRVVMVTAGSLICGMAGLIATLVLKGHGG